MLNHASQRHVRLHVILILGAAIVVRGVLAARGGQFYSSDEVVHFGPALSAARALARGNWREALTALVRQEHHMASRACSWRSRHTLSRRSTSR
jgi:hypothetical protein